MSPQPILCHSSYLEVTLDCYFQWLPDFMMASSPSGLKHWVLGKGLVLIPRVSECVSQWKG